MVRTLFSLLWTDQVGSTLSAEMALVTSVTVGALFMGMADFSATVNREFQNSAREVGLAGIEESAQEEEREEDVVVRKKSEAEMTDEEKAEGANKRKEWQFRRVEARKTTANHD
ncbi:MAG: hypothetical protein O2945_04905 [Planctomycetota bacterium]|nr:hypothetical protein [Planctomycetota bacterium]